jgi:hypothetical protein
MNDSRFLHDRRTSEHASPFPLAGTALAGQRGYRPHGVAHSGGMLSTEGTSEWNGHAWSVRYTVGRPSIRPTASSVRTALDVALLPGRRQTLAVARPHHEHIVRASQRLQMPMAVQDGTWQRLRSPAVGRGVSSRYGRLAARRAGHRCASNTGCCHRLRGGWQPGRNDDRLEWEGWWCLT